MRQLVFCPIKSYWWLTLLLVLCGVLAPVGMEAAGKIRLRKVYFYRLPSAPIVYWALAAGDKPWLIVASFVREEVGHVPHIDLTLVDWERGTVLASAKATHLQTAKVPAETCTESIPPHEMLVAVVRDRLVVKLCSSIQVFSLPGLERERVLLDVEPEEDLRDMVVSDDGRLLAVMTAAPAPPSWQPSRKVLLFDTETWKIRQEIPVGEGGGFSPRLSFSPDGRFLAIATAIMEGRFGVGDHIQVFDISEGNVVSEFDLKPLPDEDGYHTPPYLFAGAQSQWLLSSGFVKLTSEDTTYVWDWRRGTVARTITDRRGIGRLLDVSPDGLLVAASVQDEPEDALWTRDFKIWDAESGKVLYQSPRYWWPRRLRKNATFGPQIGVTFSPNGKYLIDSSGYDQVTVYAIEQE